MLVFILSITPWVDISRKELTVFALAAILLIVGIGLFNLGADLAMTPMGQYVGEGLTKSRKLGILLGVSFLMGLLITIAEPDLTVLAGQVSAVMNGTRYRKMNMKASVLTMVRFPCPQQPNLCRDHMLK